MADFRDDGAAASEDYYASGWSPYEINARKGMPFGGIPESAVIARMEESPGMDAGPGETADGAYDAFARSTLINWGPDAPGLGDEDPSSGNGNHRLNYQYYGGHGEASAVGPRHPELFLDFSDSDVPGNQLRWDEARRQAGRRINVMTATMGDNDDNHVAESPWTKVSEQRDMKTLQTWIGRTRRIHGAQYLGRDPLGGTTAGESDTRAARDASVGDASMVAGIASPARGEGYHSMGGGRERLDGTAAVAAHAGRPDTFFGGGSSGRTRGVEKFGAHRGGEGIARTVPGGRMGTRVGALGDLAMARSQIVAPGSAAARATAAGRDAIYGSKFRASAEGFAAGASLRAPSSGRVARASVAADLPGVAVVKSADSMQ
ncbi:MAG TPA: hypothetical protein QGF05_10800, partial [Dehalococcoidia bacterium]|nr:hypothetical protein [Dehalococcoidia bacterium]